MGKMTDVERDYLDECRKKLHFRDLRIPKLTIGDIDYNIEMIASEDEDYITLFKEGFITKLELIDLLSGKTRLD